MGHKPNISDVLEAISTFAESVDERFNIVDQRFNKVDERFNQVDARFQKIDERFERLEGRVGNLESQMVTKSYLDDKLADLNGASVARTRKVEQKVDRLVNVLTNKKFLTKSEASGLSS